MFNRNSQILPVNRLSKFNQITNWAFYCVFGPGSYKKDNLSPATRNEISFVYHLKTFPKRSRFRSKKSKSGSIFILLSQNETAIFIFLSRLSFSLPELNWILLPLFCIFIQLFCKHVHLLLEPCLGGELFSLLQAKQQFKTEAVTFYRRGE